eukprot:m.310078 g.310078  ORF g.310078 m.310078 type:complete len:111 (-) comp55348_c0_seq1:798-1130(-)
MQVKVRTLREHRDLVDHYRLNKEYAHAQAVLLDHFDQLAASCDAVVLKPVCDDNVAFEPQSPAELTDLGKIFLETDVVPMQCRVTGTCLSSTLLSGTNSRSWSRPIPAHR